MRLELFEEMVRELDLSTGQSDVSTVGQSVFSEIRNDILQGVLLPGMKLKLSSLQKDYGVSINTLRENLMRLHNGFYFQAMNPRRQASEMRKKWGPSPSKKIV